MFTGRLQFQLRRTDRPDFEQRSSRTTNFDLPLNQQQSATCKWSKPRTQLLLFIYFIYFIYLFFIFLWFLVDSLEIVRGHRCWRGSCWHSQQVQRPWSESLQYVAAPLNQGALCHRVVNNLCDCVSVWVCVCVCWVHPHHYTPPPPLSFFLVLYQKKI